MNPVAMAALYAAAFPVSRAWTADEIAALTRPPGFFVSTATGFALGRAAGGEAELITIAVSPMARRLGTGRALLTAFEAEARARGAQTAFLDVAADNQGAIALYEGAGWHETGRRKGYYARADGGAVDALTMAKALMAP